MYSWEIDNVIKQNNYLLSVNDYLRITNHNDSPQIVRVKYDAFSNTFEIHTNDDYHWSNIRLK